MDIQQQLFAAALQISEPIYIEDVSFIGGELHIRLNFYRGAEFACPKCGEKHKVYDTKEKTWRHLNFFQYQCFLHFPAPRIDCPDCGKHRFQPEWTREQSGFTLLFEALIVALAKSGIPFSELAKITGENDTRLRGIVDHYVEKAYKNRDFSNVSKVAIDEVSSKKGHKYVTIVTNQDDGTIMFATKGKDANTILDFVVEAQKHGLPAKKIKEISMDMSPAFQSGARDFLPNAEITFDKFHVVKLLNEAVDKVRREEQNSDSELKKTLKNTRYVWLKNPKNLTKHQSDLIEKLKVSNLVTAEAYRLKLAFQEIYRTIDNELSARAAFGAWAESVKKSGIEPMIKFAKTLNEHINGVLRYFTSRLTNGIAEGLNSIIGQVKRRARGYKNIGHFINMIYLAKGGLSLPRFDVLCHT